MKIGVDIDEVLADLINPLVEYHNITYGTTLKRDDFRTFNLWETWGGTEEEANKKLYDFFHSKFFKEVPLIQKSQESVNFLSKKHELIIITSRPEYVSDRTIKWVEKNFSSCFKEFHFTHEWYKNGTSRKKDICLNKKVDIMIEDSLDKALDCSVISKVMLYDCPWNKTNNLPKNITRVNGWEEILSYLNT
ncbi:MAG: hypothetical protein AABW81_04585 [Nanoarchaeota archaeon]